MATETRVEDLLLQLREDNGLELPLVQEWVDGHRPDSHWPERKLIVETDGYETHGTRTAFETDRERLQDLAAAGWLRRLLTPSPARAAAA